MSKSKGTFVAARTYLDHLDPSYLRYFYASKLSSRVEDLDLAVDEFVAKVNTDLVNKVVNLASRTAKFVESTGLSEKYPDDGGLFAAAAAAGDEIRDAYEACDYSRAMRLIMALADRANPVRRRAQAVGAPQRSGPRAASLQDVCTVALNLFRQLVDLPRARAAASSPSKRANCSTHRSSTGTKRRRRSSARRSPNSNTCSNESKKRTYTP